MRVITQQNLFPIIFTLLAMMFYAAPQGRGQKIIEPSAAQSAEVYICPMHPDVQENSPGQCRKCGMTLVRKSPTATTSKFELELKSIPEAIRVGEKVQLRFTILNPNTHRLVREFNIVHEKTLHLFLVSQDLTQFQHIHPIQQADGSFVVETVLPTPGSYKLFCDFFPVEGTPQVISKSVVTVATQKEALFRPANLVPDQDLTKSVDGIRFELTLNPSDVISGRLTHLNYHLVDEETGQPINDLQPYLGAWGHTVVLSEDTTEYLHAHPDQMIPQGIDQTNLMGGANVNFETLFRRPGRYRIWSQFQRRDKVSTVTFAVNVLRVDKVALWETSGWSALPGTTSTELGSRNVYALAISGSDVYVGGDFTSIGGLNANRIAKWDGHSWSVLGSGIDNGIVHAIAVDGSNVYAGGTFTIAGGTIVSRIAKWDGHTWSALAGGINQCNNPYCSPAVYALEILGSNIYVGGEFTRAGAIATGGIAMWNGSIWSSLGGGIRSGARDGIVMTLAVSGSDVYVGGKFNEAGDTAARNIAKWNGNKWSALGEGVRGGMERVRAIGISGSDVYVGGSFYTAGLVSAHNVAKWNGRDWIPLTIEAGGEVSAIAVSGGEIYLGSSSFKIPGGKMARGIVKWKDGSWSALGEGVALPLISAIRPNGRGIYVGGG